MSFKCVIDEKEGTKLLKSLVDVLASIIQKEPGQFSIEENKLMIKAMNSNQSAFVLMTMDQSFFTEFNVTETAEGSPVIGLQLEDVRKVLSRAKDTDIVTLEFTGSEHFNVTFQSDQFLKRFTLPLGEADNVPSQIEPDALGLETAVRVFPGFLKEVIADVASIGKTFSLDVKKDGLIFKTSEESQELEIKVDYKPEAEPKKVSEEGVDESISRIILDISGPTGFTIKYSLDNLKHLSKIDSMAIDTVLEMEEAKPLRTMMQFYGGKVTLDCLLSPVTEAED
ncbi:MAG: hypothetical protein ACTSP4_00415 [Candidatus Hodarchaeales archaeon]